MRNPKTIKGYISLIRQIERISPQSLKGFDLLSEEEQTIIKFLDGDISNSINEIKSN